MNVPPSLRMFHTEVEERVSHVTSIFSAEIAHRKRSPFRDGIDCTDECHLDTWEHQTEYRIPWQEVSCRLIIKQLEMTMRNRVRVSARVPLLLDSTEG